MSKVKNSIILLKLFFCIIIPALYFLFVDWLCRSIYKDYLYVSTKVPSALALVGCGVIIFTIISIKTESVKMLKEFHKLYRIVISVSIIVCCMPFVFIKCCTVADKEFVKVMNVFGDVAKKCEYKNIDKIELFIYKGVIYDMEFDDDIISIRSQDVGYIYNFKNDTDLIEFDKAVSKYCQKDIVRESWYNNRRFFKTDTGFEYFENLFNEQSEIK